MATIEMFSLTQVLTALAIAIGSLGLITAIGFAGEAVRDALSGVARHSEDTKLSRRFGSREDRPMTRRGFRIARPRALILALALAAFTAALIACNGGEEAAPAATTAPTSAEGTPAAAGVQSPARVPTAASPAVRTPIEDLREAKRSLQLALDLVDTIVFESSSDEESFLTNISRLQAAAADLEELLERVEQASAVDLDAALETASDIDDATDRVDALTSIAVARSRAGDPAGASLVFEQAVKAAVGIRIDPPGCQGCSAGQRNDALASIAAAQLYAMDTAAALRTTELIDQGLTRLLTWLNIALVQGKSGDQAGAANTVQRALQLAGDIRGTRHYHHVNLLGRIVAVQALSGDRNGAAVTLDQATALSAAIADDPAAITDGFGFPDPSIKFSALVQLTMAQAVMGDATSVIETTDLIDFRGDEAFFLRLVAREQASWGDVEGAVAWATAVVDPYERASALVGLAEGIIGRISGEQRFAATQAG